MTTYTADWDRTDEIAQDADWSADDCEFNEQTGEHWYFNDETGVALVVAQDMTIRFEMVQ